MGKFDYNDLERAFAAGYSEGWAQVNHVSTDQEWTIHHAFEDWLRNFEAAK
jgi:hypothetical protein